MKPARMPLFVAGLVVTMLPVPGAQAQVSFPGPELLGRPTDTSITINVVANAAIQAYFEYGTQSGVYTQTNPASGAAGPVSAAASVPLVVVLSGLSPNTEYFYRMVYQQTGTSSWITRAEHSFYTQRPPGSTFTFTVTADSHINIVFGNSSLFEQTLQNIAGESPDFHLDLGDTFAMDNVTTQAQANSNYLNLRSYFGLISASAPIFLALGNHEQEEGWHLGDTPNIANSPPVLSTNARKEYYLNPDPDSFYTGNPDITSSGAAAVSGDHLIEDYYAWTWGDALFVVIDPYWYSTTKPYVGNEGGGESSTPGSGDRWDWTLGIDQYLWLQQTLESSTAKYKFIFAHQVAGGMDDYGRGGAYAVPYVEWGGNNDDGATWAFDARRTDVDPRWTLPVHQLLVANHVTAFFHAHDHEYAHEQRDGVVYQLVPMAADATYGYGFGEYAQDGVYTLTVLPNSGHLLVTVSATNGVTVEYVRAFLSGAGTNGSIADTYNIPDTFTAATPSFSPGPGTYSSAQSVTITSTSSGATICYTINGTAPAATTPGTCSAGTTLANGGFVTVSASETLQAIATESGFTNSGVASAAYTLTVATPSFSPGAGTYSSAQSVTITSTSSGATICYTTNGTAPAATTPGICSTGTALANGSSVTVSASETLEAIATESGYTNSGVLSGTYTIGTVPIAFVQVAAATPQTPQSSVAVTYSKAQTANDLNIVVVGWNDTTASVSTVSDSAGNSYSLAVGPTRGTGLSQSIYYAPTIKGGNNTVTVTFTQAATYPDIRVLEYAGVKTRDVVAGASGSGSPSNSSSATTTVASELIFGASTVANVTTGAGTGFTSRIITNPDADIAEDRIVSTTGSYSATAPLSGGAWVMQMVTFR